MAECLVNHGEASCPSLTHAFAQQCALHMKLHFVLFECDMREYILQHSVMQSEYIVKSTCFLVLFTMLSHS